jgi:hypothetical protein
VILVWFSVLTSRMYSRWLLCGCGTGVRPPPRQAQGRAVVAQHLHRVSGGAQHRRGASDRVERHATRGGRCRPARLLRPRTRRLSPRTPTATTPCGLIHSQTPNTKRSLTTWTKCRELHLHVVTEDEARKLASTVTVQRLWRATCARRSRVPVGSLLAGCLRVEGEG